MSKFCSRCGAQLRPTATFCSTCGQPVSSGGGILPGSGSGTGSRLVVQELGQADRTVPIVKSNLTLGRDPTNDIVLQNPAVSRQHARLEQRGPAHWLTDLGSTNGTLVNGHLIQSQALQDGDIIRIGDQQGNSVGLTFHSGMNSRARIGTIHLDQLNLAHLQVFTIGRDPSNQVHLDHPLVSRRHAQVEQASQGHRLQDLNSSNGTFINGQPLRSPRQLQAGDVIHIGPFKLVYDQAMGLTQYSSAGDYRLDAHHLTLKVSLLNPLQRLIAGNSRLTSKLILNEVNLSIHPKEFVALVGGSGAGKSTLMKALSGFVPARGQVLLNGDNLYANFAAYRTILGYVPQDDIIHQQLTVRSALVYAAQLRLPDASPVEIETRIQQVLADVDMTRHVAKSIKQLSGGQRKRVSIAVELLAEPGLFFLDEPTSGLDPGLEKKMMYTMRQLADAGRTIVLVTHATSNIDQCTHVAFMADGYLTYFGPPREALAFFGATDFADIYSRLAQPLDPVTNPLPPQYQAYYPLAAPPGSATEPSTAEVWARCFQASPQYQRYVGGRLQAASAGVNVSQNRLQSATSLVKQVKTGVKQFWVLTRRYFELIRRDAMSMFILLAIMPLIGLLLLIMADSHDLIGKSDQDQKETIQQAIDEARANQDPANSDEQFQGSYEVSSQAQKILFMLALASNLLGLFASAYEIVKEEAIYQRERMVNLQIAPYLLSKGMVLALFAALQCLLLLLVIRLGGVHYPDEGVFLPPTLELYITLFLATLASISLGLFISASIRSSGTVIYVILLVLFIQIIFAGAIFDLPTLAKPISYLTTTRWTLEALGSTLDLEALKNSGVTCIEFEDGDAARARLGIVERPCESGQMRQAVDYDFNVSYRNSVGHLLARWFTLGIFALAFGGLTMFIQKRKDVI